MATNKTENEKLAPIIIKRVKKGGGGHHGGAWKVAYADFVTAMMAFFLLMWLLNVTTDEQKNAISNYFDPTHPRVSDSTSGAGGSLGGLAVSPDGAMVSTVQPITQPQVPDTSTRGNLHGSDQPGNTEGLDADGGFYNTLDMTEQQLEAELRRLEDQRFEIAAEELRAEIAKLEEPEGIADHVLVDVTPEGLRIQIIDDQGRSMFPSGSAMMHDFMRMLLLKVSDVITPMPNQVSVRGHTDSVRYRDPSRYDNWNLSADRAQSSRRVLVEGGVPEPRLENVMGRAEREPLFPENPSDARNRRITIMMLREKREKPATNDATAQGQTPAAQGQQNQRTQTQSTRPARGQSQRPSTGLQIIDDTQPTPSAQSATGQNAAQQTGQQGGQPGSQPQPQQPGIERIEIPAELRATPALPVQPDARGRRDVQPQSMTFDSGVPAVNKPPTIQTPVFNLGNRRRAEPKPEPSTPERAPASPVLQAPASPLPGTQHNAPRQTLTFP